MILAIKHLLTYPYRWVINFRNALYDRGVLKSYRSALPVVCVGNATVGGNGKTPLVLWIAEQLLKRGYAPVILSRGYRGTHKGPHVVDPAIDTYRTVGDEPLMMACRNLCPVVIARKRVKGAKLIEKLAMGNVIILDDGFQHRALARDVNLLCVAAASSEQVALLLHGDFLPAGVLREPLQAALRRTDAIVWQSRSPVPPCEVSADARLAGIPTARTQLEIKLIGSSKNTPKDTGCVLVTAVANPAAVRASVPAGLTILAHRVLPDHAAGFGAAMDVVRSEFAGAPIIITEKDCVKLPALAADIWVLRARLVVQDGDAFVESIVLKKLVLKKLVLKKPLLEKN